MDEQIDVVGVEGVEYESGDIAEPVSPAAKRRKSEVLQGIDLNSPENRREWPESRLFKRYYDCILDNSGGLTNFVACKLCREAGINKPAVFNYTGSHNLRHHLETAHNVQMPDKDRQKNMEDALVEFCVGDARPFSLINGKGFISFLDAYSEFIIDRHLKKQPTQASEILPSERTITRKIVDVLQQKQPELQSLLAHISVEKNAAISLDFSQKLGVDYLVMVAHLITNDWNLKHFVVTCIPLPGDVPKTRETVSDVVNECLENQGVDPKSVVFVTDEGSNVVHLGGDKHHRCIAHILATITRHITEPYRNEQAGMNDQINAINEAIKNLHTLVGELRRITPIRQALRSILVMPVATRWLSILSMIRAFINSDRQVIRNTVAMHAGNKMEYLEQLFARDYMFEAYIKIVSLVEQPLKILEAENNCTMNRFLVEMVKLEIAWTAEIGSDDEYCAALARSGLNAFNRKMTEIFGPQRPIFVRIAAFLDPAVCGVLEKICQSNQSWGTLCEITNTVVEMAKKIYPECVRPSTQRAQLSPSLSSFSRSPKSAILYEVELYQTICGDLGGKKVDLLKFWKENSKKYHFLSSLAKTFLAIPASSTSCERIFSRFAPLVYDYRRNKFDPHTISRLISLQSLFRDL